MTATRLENRLAMANRTGIRFGLLVVNVATLALRDGLRQ